MAALRELFVSFQVDFDDKPLKKGQESIKKSITSLKKLAATAGIAFSVAGINKFVSSQTKAADEIGKAARLAGLTSKEYQELGFIAERSGVGLAGMTDNVFELTKRLGEMKERGSGPAVDALRILGLGIKDFEGLSQLQSFEVIRNEISKITDVQKQAIVADQLFGGQAKATLNVLRLSGEEYRKLRMRFEELGGGFSDKFIANSEKFQDDMSDFRLVARGLGGELAGALLPHFIKFAKLITDKILPAIREFMDDGQRFERILTILGVAAGIFAANMLLASWPVVLVAAGIALLVLAVEDVMAALDGGDSVINDWVEAWTGTDLVTYFDAIGIAFGELKMAWEEITRLFQKAIDSPFVGFLKDIASALLKVSLAAPKWLLEKMGWLGGTLASGAADDLGTNYGGADGSYQALPGPRTYSGGNTSNSNQSVSINVNGAKSPAATGREVERQLKNAGGALQ